MIVRGTTPGLFRQGPLDRAGLGDELVTAGVVALAIAMSSYALATGRTILAVALALLPLAAVLVASPVVSLVLLGATLPFVQSLPGAPGDFEVSVSDLLLVLLGATVLLRATSTGTMPAVRILRPVAGPVLAYSGAVLLVLAYHWEPQGLAQTLQRYELFVLPLLVGALAVATRKHVLVLQAYVVAASALAVVWPLDSLDLNKNATGQMIGNAILLLVGVKSLHRLLPCLVALAPGLLLTQSRGAVIATIIGVVALMIVQGVGTQAIVKRVVPLALVGAASFVLLPTAAQERLTTLSAGQDTEASYALYYRQELIDDARRVFDENRWAGVGIGNYSEAAASMNLSAVEDPHQVLLLEGSEGGVFLALAFVVLIAGSLAALWRMRQVDLAPVAVAVTLATVAHGMVDVYWVRGTPVLGWLLAGMVCGLFYASRHPERVAS